MYIFLVPKNSIGQINIIIFRLKVDVLNRKIHEIFMVLNRVLKTVDIYTNDYCLLVFSNVLLGFREAKRLYARLKQFYSTNPVDNYGEATKLEEMTLDDVYDEFEDDDDDGDESDDESVEMNSDESIINDQEKTSQTNGRSKLIDRSSNKTGQMPVYRHIKVNHHHYILVFFSQNDFFLQTLKPVGDGQIIRVPLADISRCDCDPNKPDPCSSDEHCLNRMLKYECHPHVCAAG